MCETMSSSSLTGLSDGDQPLVELIVRDASASPVEAADAGVTVSEEITPLLSHSDKPKINIFSVSYSRRKPREQVTETEILLLTRFIFWVWNGSRYSGLLCMVLSSTTYFLMEVISDIFTVQSIPLFETAFMRCSIMLIFSYLWLRRSGQPIFGPAHARNLLISRALMGYVSLFSFVFCVQRLPLSQAIVLSFTTPIMASIAARIILHEKLTIADIGGLACSFFGLLFIFQHILTTQDVSGGHHIYTILVGLFSSVTGGISYCLIKAGAKASDEPVVTIFSFGILASPAAAICAFSFEEFVLPGLYSFFLMLVLGVLAFFAEVFLARGLQLEKTSKVVNVQYIEPLVPQVDVTWKATLIAMLSLSACACGSNAALTQFWGIGLSRIAPSFGRLMGCLLILISFCYTMYIGPDKEMNETAHSSAV